MSKIIIWSDLSQKERNRILEDHRQWLETEGQKGMRANLESANLERANLVGANLESANLESANLERANLESANLERANLVGANLVGANLWGANLESANLVGANLVGANLWGANLESANLVGANLVSANLKEDLKIKAIYQCGPQGSRDAYLVSFFCDDGKFYFSTGCQRGVEETQFLEMVARTHKGNKYAEQYKLAIAHCKAVLMLIAEGGPIAIDLPNRDGDPDAVPA